jgi:Flp pilus assembly pilin Flp
MFKHMKKAMSRRKLNERGQGMLEYVMLIGLVLVVVGAFRGKFREFYESAVKGASQGVEQSLGGGQQ